MCFNWYLKWLVGCLAMGVVLNFKRHLLQKYPSRINLCKKSMDFQALWRSSLFIFSIEYFLVLPLFFQNEVYSCIASGLWFLISSVGRQIGAMDLLISTGLLNLSKAISFLIGFWRKSGCGVIPMTLKSTGSTPSWLVWIARSPRRTVNSDGDLL